MQDVRLVVALCIGMQDLGRKDQGEASSMYSKVAEMVLRLNSFSNWAPQTGKLPLEAATCLTLYNIEPYHSCL